MHLSIVFALFMRMWDQVVVLACFSTASNTLCSTATCSAVQLHPQPDQDGVHPCAGLWWGWGTQGGPGCDPGHCEVSTLNNVDVAGLADGQGGLPAATSASDLPGLHALSCSDQWYRTHSTGVGACHAPWQPPWHI